MARFENQEHMELKLFSSLESQRFPCIVSTIYYTFTRIYYNGTHQKCPQYSIIFIDIYGIIDNNTHIFNIDVNKINLNQTMASIDCLFKSSMKVKFFVDGVDNQSTSPYGLGVPNEVEVVEAPPLHPQTS